MRFKCKNDRTSVKKFFGGPVTKVYPFKVGKTYDVSIYSSDTYNTQKIHLSLFTEEGFKTFILYSPGELSEFMDHFFESES